jgi:hypothetical protein
MIGERQSFVHFFRKNAVPRQRYCEEEIDNLRKLYAKSSPAPEPEGELSDDEFDDLGPDAGSRLRT